LPNGCSATADITIAVNRDSERLAAAGPPTKRRHLTLIDDTFTSCPLRVHFLTVMPSPYTLDLFAAMRADGRIDARVFYMEMAAPDTHWGQVALPADSEVLPGRWFPFLGGRMHANPGAARRLGEDDPHLVVIGGYAGLTVQWVMRWLKRERRPWVFWGELPGMRPRRRLGRLLRSLALRPVATSAHGIAAIGSRAQEAYRHLVADRCPVHNIPYCCDMSAFLHAASEKSSATGNALAAEVELPPDHTTRFLYCGQLIERKGVDLLLTAFCEVARKRRNATLTLLGTGPLEHRLAAGLPADIRARVTFAGFQPIKALPRCFAESDIFILPSRHDGWGVVVNQAIAAGMPVICSDAVGAASDLVVDTRNGSLFPAGDTRKLEQAMQQYIDHPERIKQHGAASREFSGDWTPQRCVDRWVALCYEVAGRQVPALAENHKGTACLESSKSLSL